MTIVRDFLLGYLRIYVLFRALEGPVYGVALLDDLRKRGYMLGPGTLYPALHTLQTRGYLSRESRTVGGRVRKYYTLTPEGGRALAGARMKVRGFVQEILEDALPAPIRPAHGGLYLPARGKRRSFLIRPEILHERLAVRRGEWRPLVIDVRDGHEYGAGHIPGAQHIPLNELDERSTELSGRRLHVTYCNMRHRSHARSVRAATLLREQGRLAQALDGGFPAWVAAGYPIERRQPA